MKNSNELIKTGRAVIVDVRTPEEFKEGHVPGSINIPLKEIPSRLEEFKNMRNIVLCCASGSRSTFAETWLKQNGVECENAGSWKNIQQPLQNK